MPKTRTSPHERSPAWSYPLLVLVGVAFALPLLTMLAGSLKPPGQSESDLLPTAMHWENYGSALGQGGVARSALNSLALSLLATVGGTASATVVAYGFAGVRWPGRDGLFLALLSTMLLPFHVTMLPRFRLFAALNLYGTYWPILLPIWLAQETFFVFLLRQFFLTIPKDLGDAARIDGASEFTVFLRVVLPQVRPAIITVGLFQFLAVWNEFTGPLLYLNDPNRFPLAYALEQFVSTYRTEYGPLMAGTAMFTLPAVVLFVLAQQQFLSGMARTAGKR